MGIDAHVMSTSKFGSGVPLGAVLGVDSTLTRNLFLTPYHLCYDFTSVITSH